MSNMKHDVCVVGGAGHVGLPLAIVLASRQLRTLIYDINPGVFSQVRDGRMPFIEEGGEPLLRQVLPTGLLTMTDRAEDVGAASVIIVTIGTPIDEFHNPNFAVLTRCLDSLLPHMQDGQVVILRSTVAPGTTDYIEGYFKASGRKLHLAFCPERVVQGRAIEEIQTLPQLVSGTSPEAVRAAIELFSKVAPQCVVMEPREAEFAKLICNAYRYIQFAATNQLYMMVERAGLDYSALLAKMKQGYPRMGSIPTPGFAAGPCLMKDTMELFAFEKHNFILGQIAMTINEGLPNFIVQQLAASIDLKKSKVGILGMAFKADSDDIRDSLSYKLGKLLRYRNASVLYSDEYVRDPTFVDKEALVKNSDAIVVGVPHAAYQMLRVPSSKHVVDLWSVLPAR